MSSDPLLDAGDKPRRTEASARVSRLFERHGRMVYGVCRAMLRDPHDAEDAIQQAFLSAYHALLEGARVRNEGAWIATIARNECRARIAAAMRTPLPVADTDLASMPAGDDQERRLHAGELRDALAELPGRQREAVVLRHLYGLRCSEVAIALGLSRPATEALLFRARRTLRHRLRPGVAATIAVPLAVEEALAQAISGFAAAAPGVAVAGAAGGGVLAKLTAGPLGFKVATATVAVTTVGTIGTVESEWAERNRPTPASIASTAADDDEQGPASASSRSERGDGDDASGGRDGDSGRGHGDEGGSADGDESSSSGPGPSSGHDSDRSREGPSGTNSAPSDERESADGDSSGRGSGSSESSGSESSGSSPDADASGIRSGRGSGSDRGDGDDELED